MDDLNLIHDRMLSTVDDRHDKSPGMFIYDSTRPTASESARAGKERQEILKKGMARTSYGEYLIMLAEMHGVIWKEGEKAKGKVTFNGDENTPINPGLLVQTPSGLQYVTTQQGSIKAGMATVEIEAAEIGAKYNVPSSSISVLMNPPDGIRSVTNPSPATGGVDAESDQPLRERFFERVRNPPSSGNKADYVRWTKEIDGVSGVKPIPLWDGPGTVKLIIYGDRGQAVSPEVIRRVKETLDPSNGTGDGKAPIGALITVVTVTNVTVNIEISGLQVKAGYTLSGVQNAITLRLKEYLDGVAPGETVFDKYMEALVTTVEGVRTYADLKLNGSNQDIVTSDEQKMIIGDVIYA